MTKVNVDTENVSVDDKLYAHPKSVCSCAGQHPRCQSMHTPCGARWGMRGELAGAKCISGLTFKFWARIEKAVLTWCWPRSLKSKSWLPRRRRPAEGGATGGRESPDAETRHVSPYGAGGSTPQGAERINPHHCHDAVEVTGSALLNKISVFRLFDLQVRQNSFLKINQDHNHAFKYFHLQDIPMDWKCNLKRVHLLDLFIYQIILCNWTPRNFYVLTKYSAVCNKWSKHNNLLLCNWHNQRAASEKTMVEYFTVN